MDEMLVRRMNALRSGKVQSAEDRKANDDRQRHFELMIEARNEERAQMEHLAWKHSDANNFNINNAISRQKRNGKSSLLSSRHELHFDFRVSPFPSMIEMLQHDVTGWFAYSYFQARSDAHTSGRNVINQRATSIMMDLLNPSIQIASMTRSIPYEDIAHHVEHTIKMHWLLINFSARYLYHAV
eukprot:4988749-Pleurochrysis_carterae.AAC.1